MGKDIFNKIDKDLLQRYLESEGSNKEKQQIGEWFADLLGNEELRKFSKSWWNDLPDDISFSDYDEERLQDRIHHILRLEEAVVFQKEKKKARLITIFTRIAAGLFIPLALFFLFNLRNNTEGEQIVSRTEIFSPLGARVSFILPDGSTGWLNGGSSLNFPSQFKDKHRTVELSGEAYFDVVKDKEKPFTVVTNKIKVRAYGTAFNVMAYPDDQNTEVTLETGSIGIFNENEFIREKLLDILTPGERIVYVNETGRFKKDQVIVDQYTSWKEGKLVFRNEPMTKVVEKLNRWYNVNIIISDPRLKSYTYRATFIDESLDEILKIFQLTSPIVVTELKREKHSDGTYVKKSIALSYRTYN
jgi:ferric-dicitrate binding protein FerR (iron transport regulator)